jgi:hypothetical protein
MVINSKLKKIKGSSNDIIFLTDEESIKNYITDVIQLNSKLYTEDGKLDIYFVGYTDNLEIFQNNFVSILNNLIFNSDLNIIAKKPTIRRNGMKSILRRITQDQNLSFYNILDTNKIQIINKEIKITQNEIRRNVFKVKIIIEFRIRHLSDLREENIQFYLFDIEKYNEIHYSDKYTYNDIIDINMSKLVGIDPNSKIAYNYLIRHKHSPVFRNPNISHYRQSVKGIKFKSSQEILAPPYNRSEYSHAAARNR